MEDPTITTDSTVSPADRDELEIAVVGMAGRFPGADDVEQLWANLRDGVESVTTFSDAELRAAGAPSSLCDQPGFVPAGAPLADVDCFDAPFFGISPREAELMDPQHRVFLECAWHALEHAGYDPRGCPGLVGVYAGAALSTYLLSNLYHGQSLLTDGDGFSMFLGNDKDFMASRVSYKLGLRGPSCVVQTACSSSLVAVHMACQALLGGEADMALAGGVSIMLPQGQGYLYQEGSIVSPDGHCRAFDANAGGTVIGNGVGLVVLKRLTDVIDDGDTIHAVIKGSAINNDGNIKVSFTAPRVDGQVDVIRAAHLVAGVEPATIGYVEAHGTGTPMGDPIEVAALNQAFGSLPRGTCALGSIKTNIGHLNTAAGIAGLIKAVLAVSHGQIPPSLGFRRANPAIDFDDGPFYVAERGQAWPSGSAPRRAGVSSFGIGGTNAHVVVEQAPASRGRSAPAGPQLLVLSARSEEALERATDRLALHLERHPELDLADVASTLATGRHAFSHRRAVVCEHLLDASRSLRARDPDALLFGVAEQERDLVFMFPGQGSQHVGMARGLHGVDPTFTSVFDRCAEQLRPLLGLDLREALYSTSASEDALAQTTLTQPALFCVEYALARAWQHHGVTPSAMIGHSVGEYVAACLAGVFSLSDALSLVVTRARLMAAQPPGAMLTVAHDAAEVAPLLPPGAEIAAENGPRACVVSGPFAALDAAERSLAAEGLTARRLKVSHAFHSAMMASLAEPLLNAMQRIELRPPAIPYISNVTGTWVTDQQATDPTYWFEHLRRPVRFSTGMGTILRELRPTLLEVGPGRTLGALARQRPESRGVPVLASMRHPREERADVEHWARTLGQLFVAGHTIDWAAVHPAGSRRRIPVPGYPFDRRRYWCDARAGALVPRTNGPRDERPEDDRDIAPAARHPRPAGASAYAPPRDEHERRICEIWQDLLGIERVGVHDDFFELGGQSLLASQLCARLGQQLEQPVPVRVLFEAPTIERLAARLAQGVAATKRPDHALPLADASLDLQLDLAGRPRVEGEASCVLLTGATGFLGAALVEELAARTRAQILCLVRGPDAGRARERLLDHLAGLRIATSLVEPRLEVVAGDLCQPRLGLRAADFDALARRVDAIYHAGAWVNFTYPYSVLRDTNVIGTRTIIHLACAHRLKPLHFISTAAVFSSSRYEKIRGIPEDAPVQGSADLRGYDQTKWVAEQLVSEARARGLPAAIYRPAAVTGHSRTGACNLRDLSLRMLLGCIELGAWPRLDMKFHMAPVDYVAGAIVHLSCKPESLGKAFHCTSARPVGLDQLVERVAALGYPLPVVPYQRWRERLVAATRARPDHPLAPFVPLFVESRLPPSIDLDCQNFTRGIADSDLVCPSLDAAALRTTFAYLAQADDELCPPAPSVLAHVASLP
ncbi:MAG: thioester reductase domain-containing protein [Myxococcota bacterium]